MDSKKRKKIENHIIDTYHIIDPTGLNRDHYTNKFKAMSDAQFTAYVKSTFEKEYDGFTLHAIDYENDLKLENVLKGLEHLKVPAFETLYTPHSTLDKDNIVSSKHKVPVGYLHVKPLVQFRQKKNSSTISIDQRSALTGQVTNDDKAARSSDQENSVLVTVGATNVLRELNGPRADDITMKNEMYQKIVSDGYVSLNQLTDSVENKTTLNTVDVYIKGMGLASDLVKPI